MSKDQPEMRRLPSEAIPREWERLVSEVACGDSRVLIERNGEPVAGLVSIEDFKRFQWMERARREKFHWLYEIREAFKDVPEDEFEREFAKALAEVREENRRQEHHNSAVS